MPEIPYSKKMTWVKNEKAKLWYSKFFLENGLSVTIIEGSDNFVVTVDHPLVKQRQFKDTDQVDGYLNAITRLNLGEYQKEASA